MTSSQQVENYLHGMANTIEDPEIAEGFHQLGAFYVNKLWNQLSELAGKLVNDPKFIKTINLDEFYQNFIKEFEHRIQPLQLVETVIPIGEKKFQIDRAAAFEFMKKFEKTVENDGKALVRLLTGEIKLYLEDKEPGKSQCKDMDFVRNMLDQTEKKLDKLAEVGPVHAAFYKMSAAYQRQVGDYARYYTEALRYLGCENFNQLTMQEKSDQALLLCVAALLGKGVYNFGELLAHPILHSLGNTQKEWLISVLNALNAGDCDEFQKYKKRLESEADDLKRNMPLIEEKLRLLCLMEMAMQLPPKQRNLSFDKIAKGAHLEEDRVELLVMKALANELIQGHIDQVSQIVNITWVQPRVLSTEYINILAQRISNWREDVNKVGTHMEKHAVDVITTYT